MALPHLTSTLDTVGDTGMTLVLYAQSVPQIEASYGHEQALRVLLNCTSQVCFPPRDPHTADVCGGS